MSQFKFPAYDPKPPFSGVCLSGGFAAFADLRQRQLSGRPISMFGLLAKLLKLRSREGFAVFAQLLRGPHFISGLGITLHLSKPSCLVAPRTVL